MSISENIPTSPLRFTALAMLIVLCQVTLLSGCSTQSALMMQQVEQQTSDQKLIQQVMDALQITEARMAKAQADNVDMFAPNQMDEAKSALGEARRYYERFQADPNNVNKSISLFFSDTMGEKALSLIAQANAALTQAEENKQQADTIFAESNQNLIWLKKFQAPVYFRDEYQDLERTQRHLVEYVANGRQDAARQELPRLLQEQRALETASAQRFYLYEISQHIELEGQYTLNRYAPLSYSASVGALNKARSVIAKNTRDEPAILAAKTDAEFSFAIVQAVAADMQKLVNMDRRDMERWLILLTTKLNDVGHTIGATDVRNHELMQQLDLLAVAAKQSSDQATKNTAQVATTEPPANTETTPVTKTVSDAVANTPDAPIDDQAIRDRMAQLEQSLAEQVKALSDQLNGMKAANKSAQATPGGP